MSRRSKSRSRAQKKMFEVQIVFPVEIPDVHEYKYRVDMYLVSAKNHIDAGKLALKEYFNNELDNQSKDHYNDSEKRVLFKDFVEELGGDRIFHDPYPVDRIYGAGGMEIKLSQIISRALPSFEPNGVNYINTRWRSFPIY